MYTRRIAEFVSGTIERLSEPRRRAAGSDSYWTPYSERQKDPRHYEKMF